MESRSSLRQLHQNVGDFSLTSHTFEALSRPNSGKVDRSNWQLDKRLTPPLPSLPPWAVNSYAPAADGNNTREDKADYSQRPLPSVPPTDSSWKKPRPYFMALRQLPSKSFNADEHQQYQENKDPVEASQQHGIENQQAEYDEASSLAQNISQTKSMPESRKSDACTLGNDMKKSTSSEQDDDPANSGSGSNSNQQEDTQSRNLSPLRGQFFRQWKKSLQDNHDDNNIGIRSWSPPASNKWKERAIMDPFAKRRPRVKSVQPPAREQSPPGCSDESQTPTVSGSPRMALQEPPPLNPLRLSSADKRRAAVASFRTRTPSPASQSSQCPPPTPLSARRSPTPFPVQSSTGGVSRDSSRESLGSTEAKSAKDQTVGLVTLRRVRHNNGADPVRGVKNQPKRSTLNALNEIKRKREARRAQQAEEKRRVQKELREHGDDAGYKFRRLIQQYRDALPLSQQPQKQQQLPLLPTSTSTAPALLVAAADAPKLSVFIRKRPLAKKELKAKGYDIITCLFSSEDQDTKTGSIIRRELVCHEPKLRVDCSETLENQQFCFDGVFDEWQENAKIYDATVGPMVPYLVTEATASSDTTSLTVFAYGQTGSGKTYTMKSIYRQAAVDLFHQLDEARQPTSQRRNRVTVGVSFYEIYMNSVNDLLNGRSRVQLMEDGDGAVQLPGLKELPASNADELLELVQRGENARATSANAVHDDSSRSHALLRVTLYTEGNSGGAALARLSMVDLAGSERASDTQSDAKSTRMEGAEINKSLLALKECIRALDRGATHIPFRQSKLTQLLRDSFLAQNSKTIMIATISPWSESCNHTLNTLRYADRLKEIGATS